MPEHENKSNIRKVYHFPRVRKRAENWQVKETVVEPVATKDPMPKFQGLKLKYPVSTKHKSILIEAGIVGAIALITIFFVPPLLTVVGQAFRVSLLGRFLALAIVALGIDLIWGYTGMLSLGHGVFFALGGYALAMHLQLAPLEPGRLPEFMGLYGVQELPWFWQPFYSFPIAIVGVIIIPALLAA